MHSQGWRPISDRHYGTQMSWGPDDRLYFGQGDKSFPSEGAQDINTYAGQYNLAHNMCVARPHLGRARFANLELARLHDPH